MKNKKLLLVKRFFALFVMMIGLHAGVFAQNNSEVCRYRIGSSATDYAYISVETNANGQIIVSIYPYDPTKETATAYTAFRNYGWNLTQSGIPGGRFATLTVNGDPNTGYKYFTNASPAGLSGAAYTKLTFTPVPGMVPANAQIQLPIQPLEYRTPANNNLYPTVTFPVYTYGTSCPQPTQLNAPTNLAIDATGVLTFTTDANIPAANKNTVTVYGGSVPVYTQANFTSGDVLNYTVPGTYTIVVQSLGDNITVLNSLPSASIPWTISGTPPVIPVSTMCRYYWAPTGITGGAANAIYVTWETMSDGSMKVTLDGVANNAPVFRAALTPANFSVGIGSGNGADLFSTTYSGNVCTITPLAGKTIPQGTKITYNGTVQYSTTAGTAPNNTLAPAANFTYTYGSDCSSVVFTKLDTPTNVAVAQNGTVTFDNVTNADSYQANVYLGNTFLYTQTVTNGGIINFSLPGTYNVKVSALPAPSASQYIASDLSAPVSWSPIFTAATTVPVSAYCDYRVKPTGGNAAPAANNVDVSYWSWNTNASGQLVISIDRADTASYTPTTKFRAGGMDMSGFKINGFPASVLLVKLEGSANNTTNVQTFVAAPGFDLVPGLQITFSGAKVEYQMCPTRPVWQTSGYANDLYPNLSFTTSYIYGSNCTGPSTVLAAPINLSLAGNNLTFDAVTNASGYTVNVYDNSGKIVYTQTNFTPGDSIKYSAPGYYTVKAQAIGNGAEYINSVLSTPVTLKIVGTLAAPTNLSIDPVNQLTFNSVAGAVSYYTVTVYQNAGDATPLVTIPNFTSGSAINMGSNPYGTYYVKVQAIGDGDVILDSPLSDAYTWDYEAPCNLLLTHPLVAGSADITYVFQTPGSTTHAVGDIVNTAPYFATTWNWTPSTNYTFNVANNVANIHLGDATVAQYQAQFRLVFDTPIELLLGTPYTILATVTTSAKTTITAKAYYGNDNVSFPLTSGAIDVTAKTVQLSNSGTVAALDSLFQIWFDFAPNAANTDVTISNIIVCGQEGVNVRSVTLDKNALSLPVDTTVTLVATVMPTNATDQNVTWTSSNTNVVTVANGVITTIAAGTATITVTSKNAGKIATCAVTVLAPLGIDELTTKTISVYPNPVKDVLYIGGFNGVGKDIRIVDITGRQISAQKSNGTVNVSNLAKGVYIISIDNQNAKFIKE